MADDGYKTSAAEIVRTHREAITAARASGEDLTAICARYVTVGVTASGLKAAYYRVLRDEQQKHTDAKSVTTAEDAYAVIDAALSAAEAETRRDLFGDLVADPQYAARIRAGIDRIGPVAVRKIVLESGVKVTEKRFREWLRSGSADEAKSADPTQTFATPTAPFERPNNDAERSPEPKDKMEAAPMAGQRVRQKEI